MPEVTCIEFNGTEHGVEAPIDGSVTCGAAEFPPVLADHDARGTCRIERTPAGRTALKPATTGT